MIQIQQNVALAPYTTFHIGGPADNFVVVTTLPDLKEAVEWAKKNNQDYFILGLGANILIGDKGFRGLVIKNEAKEYEFAGNLLTAQSGAIIADLIEISKNEYLSGLEDFAGIPSTVGGALWQNLHFLSQDRSRTVYIAEILQSATIYHKDGSDEEVDKEYFQFGYDKSVLHTSKDIVLSATFRLTGKNPEEIQKTIDANIAWRREKHPKDAEKRSAGSIFKQIEGYGAGRLIQQVGLKGKQIGGAKISEVHANFITNEGNATAADVRNLIKLVQDSVKQQMNLDLETEISFIGEF